MPAGVGRRWDFYFIALFVTLSAFLPTGLFAQPTYFSTEPDWSSGPANVTLSTAVGDVDGDGDLDLVCGNLGRNTLYLNDRGKKNGEASPNCGMNVCRNAFRRSLRVSITP